MMILWKSSIFCILYIFLKVTSTQCKRNDSEINRNLMRKRCDLMCQLPDKCSREECLRNIQKLSKPGVCPNSSEDESFCFNECEKSDYDCPDIKKCCLYSCGYTCRDPIGLKEDSSLPPIPYNVTIIERPKNRLTCEILWDIELNYNEKPMIFVVEARSHVGSIFSEHQMGKWQLYKFQKTAELKSYEAHSKTTLANVKLKIGRWYQFRIAAINELGFRGYSKSSNPFKLNIVPFLPEPPKNFTVILTKFYSNNKLMAKASWLPGKSILPVERYKISWSLYIRAENHSLVQHAINVKESARYHYISDILPNSFYFFQIQAISIYERRRLKSMKEEFFLNTTLPSDNQKALFNDSPSEYVTSSKILLRNAKTGPADISIRFIANKHFGIVARISWNEQFRFSFVELCTDTFECESKDYSALKIKKNQVDFGKIKFSTQYTVRLKESHGIGRNRILKTFTTPSRENWLKKFPNANKGS